METNYLTAEAVKLGDNQLVLQIIEGFGGTPKVLCVLTVEEFKAVYRMVFGLIETELEKPHAEAEVSH